MTSLACPNCNATVSAAEAKSGWCDNCGKKIPTYFDGTNPPAPRWTTRQAAVAPGQKSARRPDRFLATLVGALLGAMTSGILALWKLNGKDWILISIVSFAFLLAGVGLGRIIDTWSSTPRD